MWSRFGAGVASVPSAGDDIVSVFANAVKESAKHLDERSECKMFVVFV